MTTGTSTVTDAQLVALAERLGWDLDDAKAQWGSPWLAFSDGWRQISYLRTWEGVGIVQAAMAGLGWAMELLAHPSGHSECWFVREREDASWERARGASLNSTPDAILLAACAALGLDKEDTRD